MRTKSLPYRYESVGEYHGEHVKPLDLLDWATGKNLTVPTPLREAIEATRPSAKVAEQPLNEDRRAIDIGTRERETVLKIIAGFLAQHYKSTQLVKPYQIAREIREALQSAGLNLSDDTIASWIKEAVALLAPQKKQ